ncbi:response regulator transcription factor [Ktedonosporobacter rubrisoli]|uniref:Response regulator transcription factor n=1 Tax=Ktedonosporobacter rubrisoli TaxID=2509675 RepID=A0A4P6JUW3_KTERU|nr:response regulator transcription factor [Ktedonosporobacter rubrisoli]QBD79439.1 response regulator transcription factor [Ktedonosporobacter rubrisoli]
MATILIVEDEVDLSHLIRAELEADGQKVVQAFDGVTAVQYVEKQSFDLIILDWMLPDLDGLAVCRRIRERYLIPIVMLTARTALVDRVLGLEVGADDYVSKPFSMQELRARISAVLRRVAFERGTRLTPGAKQPDEATSHVPLHLPTTPPLRRGSLCICQDERVVTLDNEIIDLTRKEYDLLLLLASYPGRTFGREFLIEQIWGNDYEGLDRVVDTQIKRLRKKLGPFGDKLVAVWGIGYRFVG